MAWYRNDKAAVAEALRGGQRPDLATTMASGPLDELVANTSFGRKHLAERILARYRGILNEWSVVAVIGSHYSETEQLAHPRSGHTCLIFLRFIFSIRRNLASALLMATPYDDAF